MNTRPLSKLPQKIIKNRFEQVSDTCPLEKRKHSRPDEKPALTTSFLSGKVLLPCSKLLAVFAMVVAFGC
jgi:hypothetical protein